MQYTLYMEYINSNLYTCSTHSIDTARIALTKAEHRWWPIISIAVKPVAPTHLSSSS